MRSGVAPRDPIYPIIPHIWTLCVDCILSAERLDGLAAVSDEFLRLCSAGRLCYYTHDWFRPGRTDVHPAIGPCESQPVLGVRFGFGEGFLESFVHAADACVGACGRSILSLTIM